MSKYKVTMPNGMVVECETAEDVLALGPNVYGFSGTVSYSGGTTTPVPKPPENTAKPTQYLFVPTGEVRVPRDGEFFLANPDGFNNYAVAFRREMRDNAIVNWMGGPVPIYRRVSVGELKCPTHVPTNGAFSYGYNTCLAKLGINP